jgi:hypothetical protein
VAIVVELGVFLEGDDAYVVADGVDWDTGGVE